MKDLIETWEINNRINLYLLDAIEETHLDSVASSKGRNVAEQFAHIHNVRLMWLRSAEPDLLEGLNKLEKENLSKDILRESLVSSARAIASLMERSLQTGKVKGFKPHAAAFAGYLISHEAHHRALIIVALKQSGHMIEKKVAYGMWEWGVR